MIKVSDHVKVTVGPLTTMDVMLGVVPILTPEQEKDIQTYYDGVRAMQDVSYAKTWYELQNGLQHPYAYNIAFVLWARMLDDMLAVREQALIEHKP
jgi:hypothetical protein